MRDQQGPRFNSVALTIGVVMLLIVLGGTGSAWALIPLSVIGGVFALAWRYLTPADRGGNALHALDVQELEHRVDALEAQLRQVGRDHDRLEEMVRWQERLLQQSAVAPLPPAAVPSPAPDQAALRV